MGLFGRKKEEPIDQDMVTAMAMMVIIGAALCEKSYDSSYMTLSFGTNIMFSLHEDSGTECLVRGFRDASSKETKNFNINNSGTFPCTVEMYQQFKNSINPSKVDSEGLHANTVIMNSNSSKSKKYYEAVEKKLRTMLSPSQCSKLLFNGTFISFRK